MKILIGMQAIVQLCKGKYYDDMTLLQFERFGSFCDTFICACHCKSVENPTKPELKSNKIKYHFLPRINTISSLVHKKQSYKTLYEVVQSADCCIVMISCSIGNEIFKIARKLGKPCLCIQINSSKDALWYHSLKGKIVMPFYHLTQRKIARQATHTIYVSEQFLQEHYPTFGKSVGCSDVCMPVMDSNVLCQRLDSIKKIKSINELTIVTCAAVNVKYKSQADVIKAMALLKKKGFDLRYLMVGGGSQERLRALAQKYGLEDNVRFTGQIPHDEIFSLLDSADICIHPSRQEGLPRAVVEAMSRGLPVLGAKTGGIPELIPDKYIFDKGDVHRMVQLIETLTIDDMLKMAETNFEKAKEYQTDVLDERRQNFVKEFLHDFNLI